MLAHSLPASLPHAPAGFATYTIHRYPAELIDVVRLSDGQRVTIRPVLPQDDDLLQAFVRALSSQARRNRFFRTLHQLPPDLLTSFTHVDYHTHVALVAEVFIDGVEVIVGEARYVRDEGGSGAEFAVTIADGWQHQGIGRRLLRRLECYATAEGIKQLWGQVLLSNDAMQRLARKTGFEVRIEPQVQGLARIEKHLNQG